MATKFMNAALRVANRRFKPGFRWQSTAAAAQALQNAPVTEVSKLENGLNVASEDTGSNTATVAIWIDAGARYENESHNGVAHFVEHLAFKGTAKRSQADLEAEVESIGAQLHAHTSRERTVFYAKCLSKDVPKAVELLADIVQNSKLSEADVDRERDVILEEAEAMESNYREVVLDHLHSIAYQGTPLGRTLLGPTKNIRAMKREHLKEYVDSNFKAPRMILTAAGGVEHSELSQLAKQHLSSVSVNYPGAIPQLEPCRYTGSEIRVRNDDLPFVHVALAVETAGWSDPSTLPLMLASKLIGSWDKTHGGGKIVANRLAAYSHEYNLCETFEAFNIAYRDTGLWGIYFVGDHHSQDDMIFNIQQEWMRLCTNLGAFELERAKNLLRLELYSRLDSNTSICEDIGRQMILAGRRVPLSEIDAQIQSLTVGDVKSALMTFIYDRCPVVAGVGPTENLPDYNVVRSAMYWLRL